MSLWATLSAKVEDLVQTKCHTTSHRDVQNLVFATIILWESKYIALKSIITKANIE